MFRGNLRALCGTAALAILTVACSTPDPDITAKVKAKLAADDTVKAYKIDVEAKDRIVTVMGEVDSVAAKSRVVELARATEGVRDVIDQTTLTAAATAPAGGGDVAATKENGIQIAASSNISAGRVAIATTTPHRLRVGDSVRISNHRSTPPLNGTYKVTAVFHDLGFEIAAPTLAANGAASGTISKTSAGEAPKKGGEAAGPVGKR